MEAESGRQFKSQAVGRRSPNEQVPFLLTTAQPVLLPESVYGRPAWAEVFVDTARPGRLRLPAANTSRRLVSRRFGSRRLRASRESYRTAIVPCLGSSPHPVPNRFTRLTELTGRKNSNLSRTLKTMERYGFVQLRHGARGSIIPKVPYQTISLTLPLSRPGLQGTEAA